MDALIQEYSAVMNNFKFNRHSVPALPRQNHVNGYKVDHGSENVSIPSTETPSEGNASEEVDYSDAFLKFITQTLMEEEDLEHKPCMFQDSLALQAAEKSFYDVLGEKYPPPPNQETPFGVNQYSDGPDFAGDCSSQASSSSIDVNNFVESNWIRDSGEFESSLVQSSHVNYDSRSILHPNPPSIDSSNSLFSAVNEFKDLNVGSVLALGSTSKSRFDFQPTIGEVTHFLPNGSSFKYDPAPMENTSKVLEAAKENGRDNSPNGSKGKKKSYREDSDYIEERRSNKQLASYALEFEQSEMYDKVLLCPHGFIPGSQIESKKPPSDESPQDGSKNKLKQNEESKGSNRGRPRGKKQGIRKEVVDLRSLLTQCAQAVAGTDLRTANELLMRIRQHSSAHGDGTERLAHYFAIALEARLSGTGTALYTSFTSSRISAADFLKAYQVYVLACPFRKMSNIFANKSIKKLANEATRLHIIDFGILYGFQWPCLIQGLAGRPGGPPMLRITGIDLPQSGFRPAERVEETGRRLKNYCQRFNVPFEYKAIAKKWDTIQLEDLGIDRDELLIVNCLYRLGNVPDETVAANSPRDAVLNLINRINPDMFIHGIVNGTYNTPFFATRFREALFHYSAMFDMFEATVLREDQDRMRFEKEVYGRDAVNIIACEGTQRVERPETYKQWQVRNRRAGYRQLPLDQEIVKFVRNKVKSDYNKDFVVDEDGNWMLQGWRGRVLYALSYWKPLQK
ncbi:unnamed protein product [Ilex paraguariensis]|uniref:Scarecrow-like protein 14 n=1 Tax=Ilex paraguariensis TaxID=185542 RepID=A0ABC8V1Q9_9AQUA